MTVVESKCNSPVAVSINKLADEAHDCAVEKGWYDRNREPPELLALIHSELSECLEAFRDGGPIDKHLPGYYAVEVELADAVIRILDMAAYLNLDLGGAIIEKIRFNWCREERHGGKVY